MANNGHLVNIQTSPFLTGEFLCVAVTTTNSSKNTIHPLFIVTKQHTTLTTILTRIYDVMQWLLHEEAPFYDNYISNRYIAKNYAYIQLL